MQKIMANHLKTDLVSYTRRVCGLYKAMIRDQYWKNNDFLEMRYQILLIRAEFDKNKGIKDTRRAKMILERAEQKFVDNMHPCAKAGLEILPFSKDGIAYGRNEDYPDSVMDLHHPAEKSVFPYYFAKREQMKDEYLAIWDKKVRKATVKEGHKVGDH